MLPTGERIWTIFQHERNSHIKKERNRVRIVQLNYSNCNLRIKDGYVGIWGYYPYPESNKPPALLNCEIQMPVELMDKVFKPICIKLDNLQKRYGNVPIAVFGKWHSRSKCIITNRKQISILKPY